MAQYTTVRQTLDDMVAHADPAKARGTRGVIQFHFVGDPVGEYHLVFEDGQLSLGQGAHPAPDTVVTIAAKDWLALYNQQTSHMKLMLRRRLKVKGSMALGMKLQDVMTP